MPVYAGPVARAARTPAMDADPKQPKPPGYAAEIAKDVLLGGRRLHSAFLQRPVRYTMRRAPLVRPGDSEHQVWLIRSGCALRSCGLPDGHRAILDIAIAGDVVGLDHIVLRRPIEEVTAASRVGHHALRPTELRELLDDPTINLHVLGLLTEMHWRRNRLAAIGRLHAQARICVMLVDLYDRLRHRGLISDAMFHLPMTQQQMAEHLGMALMHVNRTLRRLREERVVLVQRGIVVIWDLDRMRDFARGLPAPPSPRLGGRSRTL